MAENIENTSVVWKNIADMWNTYFTPPSRISPGEVEKYKEWRKSLKEKGAKTALVLGATPEIRDALNESGYKSTIIDINKEMIRAMDSVMKTNNHEETIVCSNWLENSLESGYFDVVVGDAVLPNLPYNERQKFFSEAKRLLKPNGVFLTRAFCVPKEKKFATLEELIEHFKTRKPTYENALKLELELQILSYDPKTHLGTFMDAKKLIETIRGENGFDTESENLDKTLDIVWDFWSTKFIDKVFVYEYRAEEEKEYSAHFDIVETYESEDNEYSKITPMYVLKMH
ncbi:MAG: class I SAM-dependent methyltransferase [Candidatus Aenigmarchaeota archaeon]|nr:class I SAM-dependent methyltransferase [Candidatus Aenigmarchaeota archaeon]